MEKKLHLPIKLSIVQCDNEEMIEIEFGKFSIHIFCLYLLLLKDEYISKFGINESERGKTIYFELNRNINNQCRASVIHRDNKIIKLLIDKREIDYWICFFSKYIIYGCAEVNHIDVEIDNALSQGLLTLILSVDKSGPPRSIKEASDIFGEDMSKYLK